MTRCLRGSDVSVAALAALIALPVAVQDPLATSDGTADARSLSRPNAGRNFPDHPLFGRTRVHATLSMDSGTFGTWPGPRNARRFATGAEIPSNSAPPVRVIEIAAPRWTADDARYFGPALPDEARLIITWRADTLPVWHMRAG